MFSRRILILKYFPPIGRMLSSLKWYWNNLIVKIYFIYKWHLFINELIRWCRSFKVGNDLDSHVIFRYFITYTFFARLFSYLSTFPPHIYIDKCFIRCICSLVSIYQNSSKEYLIAILWKIFFVEVNVM